MPIRSSYETSIEEQGEVADLSEDRENVFGKLHGSWMTTCGGNMYVSDENLAIDS